MKGQGDGGGRRRRGDEGEEAEEAVYWVSYSALNFYPVLTWATGDKLKASRRTKLLHNNKDEKGEEIILRKTLRSLKIVGTLSGTWYAVHKQGERTIIVSIHKDEKYTRSATKDLVLTTLSVPTPQIFPPQ